MRHHRPVEVVTAPTIGVPILSSLHPVGDQLQVSTIRLEAMSLGRTHGLDADAVERLGIVATEMAANIVRHAGSGQIILRAVGEHTTGCIEILALDKGPGIADKTRAMRDGLTPPGGVPRDAGIAGIRRLANLFDLYSHTGAGTAVVAHVGANAAMECSTAIEHGSIGAVCVPLHGEEECGDAWMVDVAPERVTLLLVDGLGHGPEAAVAARAATAIFHESARTTPVIMLGAMHATLRSTRGAALSMATVDMTRRTVCFGGVGNVDGRVLAAEANRHLIPQNGIVGHTMPQPHFDETPWPAGGRLLLHSDGISSRWRPDAYPGLLARHPALLAGVLFRDFARARDDATVLVIRDLIPTTPS
jgi:anti-sigma regulatory factor (Ser/Thr protein kinase)